ncbi:MAG TPA: DUF892 family protein [Chthoniobacterales bacterium]|nr:DUF892 family protein [Chthoniobacterales bacterium]
MAQKPPDCAKKQVINLLLRMIRLASNSELRGQLKADSDNAKGHVDVIKTIISSYQGVSPVQSCAAMKGLIASSELLFNTCIAANADTLDTALICASLDIVHHELARLERLRLYAKLLSDWQTVTILNALLDDVAEAKRRLATLMDCYVDLDSAKNQPAVGSEKPGHRRND